MAGGASFHLYRFHIIVVLTMEFVVTLNIARFKSVLCIFVIGYDSRLHVHIYSFDGYVIIIMAKVST